ncbi:MAG: hypothetical protein A2788_00610 [Candidatus Abawacabacteria bacterium RIFCSPHIGHO2_01_FULL_46_8]|uniref:DUF304 domain-containing protein n=1 Tax=Candidatus Abawacabacteria bacterium RIFCSPHIGHO2_01_FULL_46_8 TaxID=1817815 RepID=A0A1F4XI26_9BACT|nr:MAG: hypothetical protein A2788_00610 [Candidatus Abawacabacteria bacterium RIFCSPHIGHO2_01_FULL_46_8]
MDHKIHPPADAQTDSSQPAPASSAAAPAKYRAQVHYEHIACAKYIGINCIAGEEILMFIRRHWLFEAIIALQGLAMALVPVAIWLFFRTMLGVWNLPVLFLILIYIQFVLLYSFKNWLDFYLDVIVVTSHKVVDINQEGLFNRRISETSLARVQDAVGRLEGFLGTILKFGRLDIQTAGSDPNFSLDKVAYPIRTASAIQDIQARYLQNMVRLTDQFTDV